MFDTAAYLQRIAYDGSRRPTAATLLDLQLAHLYAVPFENLDIHRGQPLTLDEDGLFAKIVRRRRGGFCFELNGLFARLLRSLGYEVDLLAAQMPREPDIVAPAFDHLALQVIAPGGDERWLVDVGAGRGSFLTPLRLGSDEEQLEPVGGVRFRLVPEGERRRIQRQEAGGTWEAFYAFSPCPRLMTDFTAGCLYHQTSPDSPFTRGILCSLATPDGRVTISGQRLIITDARGRTDRPLADEAATLDALRTYCGIDLSDRPGGDDRA